MLADVLTVLVFLSGLSAFRARQVPVFELRGDTPGDYFGVAVAGGGDVNGDRIPDILIGAYNYAQQLPWLELAGQSKPVAGYVKVFSGRDGGLLHTLRGDSNAYGFGMDVADAGDVDKDEHADIIVASPYMSARALVGPGSMTSGLAHVYSGKDGSLLATLSDKSKDLGFGMSVFGAGDLNGDGHADVAVGYPHLTDIGLVLVYSGRDWSVLLRLEAAQGEKGFGESAGNAGDVDGDGVSDVIVGARRAGLDDSNKGLAKVFSGKTGKVIHAWPGDQTSAYFGSSLAGLGDLDGDGRPEILVCAQGLDRYGPNAGGAFVYSGREGSLLFFIDGPEEGAEFGIDCCALRDANGDEIPDFAIAEWETAGRTRVYSGKDGSLLFDCPGTATGSLGDIDGDGFGDLLTGAVKENEPGTARAFSVAKALSGAVKKR